MDLVSDSENFITRIVRRFAWVNCRLKVHRLWVKSSEPNLVLERLSTRAMKESPTSHGNQLTPNSHAKTCRIDCCQKSLAGQFFAGATDPWIKSPKLFRLCAAPATLSPRHTKSNCSAPEKQLPFVPVILAGQSSVVTPDSAKAFMIHSWTLR